MREITAWAIWFWNFTSSASTLEQSFCFAFPPLFIRAAFVRDSVGSAQKLRSRGWVFPSNMKFGVDENSSSVGEGAVASRVCVCAALGTQELSGDFPCPHLEFESLQHLQHPEVAQSSIIQHTELNPIMNFIFQPQKEHKQLFFFVLFLLLFVHLNALGPWHQSRQFCCYVKENEINQLHSGEVGDLKK